MHKVILLWENGAVGIRRPVCGDIVDMRLDPEEIILMQSTGHFDSKDNEIFDYDLLSAPGTDHLMMIMWDRIYPTFRLIHFGGTDNNGNIEWVEDNDLPDATEFRTFEVVGNFYENRELLND